MHTTKQVAEQQDEPLAHMMGSQRNWKVMRKSNPDNLCIKEVMKHIGAEFCVDNEADGVLLPHRGY
ncbi:uncharacterized protein PHALS_00003 [Plasmopara halstedii]|uniref:Uncharacterized protein n=1 Tax=Plasmopara halstedii TaxID=4781 RepID=A0A0N7L6G9_PLAHL|nr:uncharacterized protein PHALS_00003 [Plasmopara halstedii]CEG44243.1 hypothetical protein PHALS_00003 [Plasmopara halstedii]|eukprot:XP_024580612.1 hypothetical protein PHALS_00003 [Plasmopara halstedii]